MPTRAAKALLAVLAVLAVLLTALVAAPPSAQADEAARPAATAASAYRAPAVPAARAADVGRVRGSIVGARGQGNPKVKVSWFTRDWRFLGSRKFYGGGYQLALPAGTYRLQFVDQRPAYDTAKYAPADVTVTARAGRYTNRNVRMQVGGSIGGKAMAGGRPAAGATVIAASPDERSFTTVADGSGNFALGGLPAASYSVFTYDKSAQWVGPSVFVRQVKLGTYRPVNPRLTKRAGTLNVGISLGDSFYTGSGQFLTAVSRTTGQFWTAKVRKGNVVFRGLQAGGYRIVTPALGTYLGGTFAVKGKVRPGRSSFANLRLTRQGATLTGRITSRTRTSQGLGGALVQAFSATGGLLGKTTSRSDGSWTIAGPITTQRDITVVAAPPDRNNPWLGTNPSCRYGKGSRGSIAATAGRTTSGLDVQLPVRTDADQSRLCTSPDTSRSAS